MVKPQTRLRHQRIRTKFDNQKFSKLRLSGWLAGRMTYLWIGDGAPGDAMVSANVGGRRLYRLAKAIVRHFEAEQ